MPELQDMTCKACSAVKTVEEIKANDGYCDDCAVGRCVVCREPLSEELVAADKVLCDKCDVQLGSEAGEPANEDELTPDERKALRAYRQHQTYMQEYNQRPHVKARRKEYTTGYNKKKAAAIKRLREMGVIEDKRKPAGD